MRIVPCVCECREYVLLDIISKNTYSTTYKADVVRTRTTLNLYGWWQKAKNEMTLKKKIG